jgi:hypothetical protein
MRNQSHPPPINTLIPDPSHTSRDSRSISPVSPVTPEAEQEFTHSQNQRDGILSSFLNSHLRPPSPFQSSGRESVDSIKASREDLAWQLVLAERKRSASALEAAKSAREAKRLKLQVAELEERQRRISVDYAIDETP